jgi:WD40 repeat protein
MNVDSAKIVPTFSLPSGTLLHNGDYSVAQVLGQGGFGITYLGRETRLDRTVAIKEFFLQGCSRQDKRVLPVHGLSEDEYATARQRFLNEGRILARFRHPCIVHIHSVFEENNTAYMVMEYLEGRTLLELLEERGEPLSEVDAVGYIEHVGNALAVVHGVGLLHRDIKPENVMILADGRAVLIDFGIAGAIDEAGQYGTRRVRRTLREGTPGYTPLEQYVQHVPLGPFTDIYALAATLYHLLTDELPVSAIERAAGLELPDVRQLNPGVSETVARAVMQGLAMEIVQRPQSAQEFLDQLAGRSMTFATARDPHVPSHLRRPATLSRAAPAFFHVYKGHFGKVRGIAFSPGGEYLATVADSRVVGVWMVHSGRFLRALTGHSDWVRAVAFAPDGRTLASGGSDKTVRLWDVRSGRCLQTLQGGRGEVTSLAFAPDGKVLVSGNHDDMVHVWDVGSGDLLRTLQGHKDWVRSVSLAPDGRTLASGGSDLTVRWWDVRTGEPLRTLLGHSREVNSVAFSPDGRLLASASRDTTVKLWAVRTGQLLHTLTQHREAVNVVAFAPGGDVLASGSDDHTVKIWDSQTGILLRTLPRHGSEVTALAFSPDGELLGSSSFQEVWTWRL